MDDVLRTHDDALAMLRRAAQGATVQWQLADTAIGRVNAAVWSIAIADDRGTKTVIEYGSYALPCAADPIRQRVLGSLYGARGY